MDTKIYGFYANVEMLEQKEVFRHLFCGLSQERQKKIEGIRPEKERARSLMAGALLDVGLFRLFDLRERDAVFSYGEQGKPCLRDCPNIHFNLSHSGDYALAVFAPVAVGCDIQQRGQAKNSGRIAARFFAEGEQRALSEGADFYRIWARKESFLKLTGAGMAFDMRAFCVTDETCMIDGSGKNFHNDGTKSFAACVDLPEETCRFADFELPGYCLSACYASAETLPVEWIQMRLEDFWEK